MKFDVIRAMFPLDIQFSSTVSIALKVRCTWTEVFRESCDKECGRLSAVHSLPASTVWALYAARSCPSVKGRGLNLEHVYAKRVVLFYFLGDRIKICGVFTDSYPEIRV